MKACFFINILKKVINASWLIYKTSSLYNIFFPFFFTTPNQTRQIFHICVLSHCHRHTHATMFNKGFITEVTVKSWWRAKVVGGFEKGEMRLFCCGDSWSCRRLSILFWQGVLNPLRTTPPGSSPKCRVFMCRRRDRKRHGSCRRLYVQVQTIIVITIFLRMNRWNLQKRSLIWGGGADDYFFFELYEIITHIYNHTITETSSLY